MSALEVDTATTVDALVVGTVFLDVVFSGVADARAGTETWADRRELCPGGIANNAVALARLGLSTGLIAPIGDDAPGELVASWLRSEPGLDLSGLVVTDGIDTPITAAFGDGSDRAFVSHGALDPVPVQSLVSGIPRSRQAFVSLRPEPCEWAAVARADGSRVFAGVGYDERHGWSHEVLENFASVDVLVLNELEATAYAREPDVEAAARSLARLVPTVVVTRGKNGSLLVDDGEGVISTRGVSVTPVDATGAGDVFVSALMRATAAGMPFGQQLRFANLCAAMSVEGLAGAASAPRLSEVLARAQRVVDPELAIEPEWLAALAESDAATADSGTA